MKRKTRNKIETPLVEYMVGPMSQLRDEVLGLEITNGSDKVRYLKIYREPYSFKLEKNKTSKKKFVYIFQPIDTN